MDDYAKEFEFYNKIGDKLVSENNLIEKSQMFGKPCFKINGKAFSAFFKGSMVFKMDDETRKIALSLSGSELWDPSGKKRPMKEWVCVSFSHYKEWDKFVKRAVVYSRNFDAGK